MPMGALQSAGLSRSQDHNCNAEVRTPSLFSRVDACLCAPSSCVSGSARISKPRGSIVGLRPGPRCVFSFWLYEQLRRLVGIGYLD